MKGCWGGRRRPCGEEVREHDGEKRRNEDLLLDGERELKAFFEGDVTIFSAGRETDQGGKCFLALLFVVVSGPSARLRECKKRNGRKTDVLTYTKR